MTGSGRRRAILVLALLTWSAGATTDVPSRSLNTPPLAHQPQEVTAASIAGDHSAAGQIPAPSADHASASGFARETMLPGLVDLVGRVATAAGEWLQPATADAQEPLAIMALSMVSLPTEPVSSRIETSDDVGTTIAAIHPLSGLEPVLIELMLGRIASRTVEAYRAGDAALVPVRTFFEMAEIRTFRRPDGAIEAMVQPGNVPLVLDPASRSLRLGKQVIQLGPEEMVATPGDIYLSTTVLARAFSLEWDISWPDLQVVVLEPGTLPVARRIRRESMLRAQLLNSSATEPAGFRLGVQRSQLKGLVLDYSLLTPTNGLDAGAYATTMGLDVFGGSLALGVQSQNGTERAPRTEASWSGVWRDNRWLSQAQLGDGVSTGPRARSLRGVSVSNSPYVRPSILGNVPFEGQLGAGWTVEASRGGRLIGFDSVNSLGQYSFDVPIQYGENPIDFVAYGPFGEVREFNQTYRMQTEGLPARRLEYGASAGECRTSRCTGTANLDLRYGISTRWTARAGLDQFGRDSLDNLTHPYVGLLGAVTNSITVEGEAVGDAVLRGAVRYEPSVNLAVQAEAHRFARSPRDPILTPEGRLGQFTLSAFLRPVGQLGGTFLEASLDRIHATSNDLTSARLGSSVQVSGVRVMPAVRVQTQTTGAGPALSQAFFSLNTFVLPQPALGKVLGRMTARTTLDVERGAGASSASAFLSTPSIHGLRAETGITWMRGSRGPGFSLLIAAELPSVRSYTSVTAGGGQEAMGTQYVTGSAIYNPARGSADFYGNSSLSRGGVTGRVFLDVNGNGTFDRDEQGLEGVRVVVGPTFDFSDANGAYHVWDILPYEPAQVMVDSASLASPLWVPGFAVALVEPSPNRYRSLDVPIVPAGVIEGRLTGAGARRAGPAAITLILENQKTGEKRRLDTFSDGSFYAMGVRAGEWRLSVDPTCLALLGATATPIGFVMKASAEGESVSGLELVVE